MDALNYNFCLLLLLSFFITGCQEYYEPLRLNNSERMLVINGKFCRSEKLISVDLQYSSPFGENKTTYINDAVVSLHDNFANSYKLPKTSNPGNYEINCNEVSIIQGAKYYIRVEISNGSIYESVPEEIPEPIEISDVDAESGIYTIYLKDASGKVYTKKYDGVFVNVSARNLNNSKSYMRFQISGFQQTHYRVSPTDPNAKSFEIRCVDSIIINPYPIVEETYAGETGEKIKNRKVGFAYYTYDETTITEITNARTTIGWILYCDVFSISPKTYLYYKEIEQFLTNDNKMFDPMPTQITGNIKCLSDTNEVVLGNFELANKQRKYYAFHWRPGKTGVDKKALETYNQPDSVFCINMIDSKYFDSVIFNKTFGYNWIDFSY